MRTIPTPFDKLRERYLKEPQFRQTVDAMMAMIAQLNMSPGEMREAAVFAEIKFQETFVGQDHFLDRNIVRDRLEQLEKSFR